MFSSTKCSSILLVLSILLLLVGTDIRAEPKAIRLSVVHVPQSSGLLDDLLPIFEQETGHRILVSSSEEPYEEARACKADLVVSHYGHHGTEDFILAGLGRFPRPVFANQAALIGSKNDPAGIRDMEDAVSAMTKIADSGVPFVVNHAAIERYLGDVLIAASGSTPNVIDVPGLRDEESVRYAAQIGGYVLWGIIPFELLRRAEPQLGLEALSHGDSLFQRIMVSVVVNTSDSPNASCVGGNASGAEALQRYFLEPRTQGRIRAFRMDKVPFQIWWPAGRHNSGPFIISLGFWN